MNLGNSDLIHKTLPLKRDNKSVPPPNYIAGLGRGAVGFTTRGDLGRIRTNSYELLDDIYFPNNKNEKSSESINKFELEKENDFSSSKHQDDVTWDNINNVLIKKKKFRLSKKLGKSQYPKNDGIKTIVDNFSDLKKNLKSVTFEEWDSLPESSNSIQTKKNDDHMVLVSDSIILSRLGNSINEAINPNTELQSLIHSESNKKTQAQNSSTVFDTNSYLSNLDNFGLNGYSRKVGNLKKAQLLLKSVTTCNPTHGPGWIAAARLEESSGHLSSARKIIEEACSFAPTSEDVWLEAARLNDPPKAKVILKNAVYQLPSSEKIWLKAASFESSEPERYKRVLRRAIENIPGSEKLWKALISCEKDENDSHLLLKQGVKHAPLCVDLWLALAKLENYESARKILDEALSWNPHDISLCASICALEETYTENNQKNIDEMMQKLKLIMSDAVCEFPSGFDSVDRLKYLSFAEEMEKSNKLLSCRAIVHSYVNLCEKNIDIKDCRSILANDAQEAAISGFIQTARGIHEEMIRRFSTDKQVLLSAIFFEKKYGNKDTIKGHLEYAISTCPESELLWLISAKEAWKSMGDIQCAREILARAFNSGHNSERMWLANFKLEYESNCVQSARDILMKAQEKCPTEGVYFQSVSLELEEFIFFNKEKDIAEVYKLRDIIRKFCLKFPKSGRAWILAAKFELDYAKINQVEDSVELARNICVEGTQFAPSSEELWLFRSKIEEKYGTNARARSILELGRSKASSNENLWVAAIHLERHANNNHMVNTLIDKALRANPKSGKLWAEYVLNSTKMERNKIVANALDQCLDDTYTYIALGKIYARENNIKQARICFEKAINKNLEFADPWIIYYRFEVMNDQIDAANALLERFSDLKPNKGLHWENYKQYHPNRHATHEKVLKDIVANTEVNI